MPKIKNFIRTPHSAASGLHPVARAGQSSHGAPASKIGRYLSNLPHGASA